eukprot:767121-Hanusia_phi.AAC.2
MSLLPILVKSPSADSPTSKSQSVTSLPRCTSEIGYSKGVSKAGDIYSPGAERERALSKTDSELQAKLKGMAGDFGSKNNAWVSSSTPVDASLYKKKGTSRRKQSMSSGHGPEGTDEHVTLEGLKRRNGGTTKFAFTNTERKALKEISSLSKFCYFKVDDPRLELKDPDERFKDVLIGESTGWEDRLEESIKQLRQRIKDEKHSLSTLTQAEIISESSSSDPIQNACPEGDEAIRSCRTKLAEGDYPGAQKALQKAKREYIRLGLDKRILVESLAYEIEKKRESESKLKFFEVEFQELLGQLKDLFAAKDLSSCRIKLQEARRVQENIMILSSDVAMGLVGKLENMQRLIEEEEARRQRLLEDLAALLREVDELIEGFDIDKASSRLQVASDLCSSSFIQEEEKLARYRERILEAGILRQEVLERAAWSEKNAIASCELADFSSARKFHSDAAQSYESIRMQDSAALSDILARIEEGESAKLRAESLANAESLMEQARALLEDREWDEALRIAQAAGSVFAGLALSAPPRLTELMEQIVEGKRAEEERRKAEVGDEHAACAERVLTCCVAGDEEEIPRRAQQPVQRDGGEVRRQQMRRGEGDVLSSLRGYQQGGRGHSAKVPGVGAPRAAEVAARGS